MYTYITLLTLNPTLFISLSIRPYINVDLYITPTQGSSVVASSGADQGSGRLSLNSLPQEPEQNTFNTFFYRDPKRKPEKVQVLLLLAG